MPPASPESHPEVVVRLVQPEDHQAIAGLFYEGVEEGQVRDNDTGADIENITQGYLGDDDSAFWVACVDNAVIGMVGVQKTSDGVAEIRRLRVSDAFRRKGVGTRLMEQALTFCRERGYLRVVLDVRIDRGPAISLFEKFGFNHSRTREINGRKMLDFLFDLYSGRAD
jgi:ribosomal protein S18 acetylase RimI-like enzyme